MEIGNGEFWHGDCQARLAAVPDGSVDMVVTSPPYDSLRSYNGMPAFTFDTFHPIADELARVIKPGGVIVWNVGDATVDGSETGSSFRQALYFKDVCGLNLHDTMIWEKTGSGALGSQLCYGQNFEYMFVLSKGKPKAVNLIADRENVVKSGSVKTNGSIDANGDFVSRVVERKPFGKRTNIWRVQPQQKTGHPAPFPVALPQDHILSWSNPGDLVIDPFGGSGTTAIAAENTGRRWLLTERDLDYYAAAVARIYDHVSSRQLLNTRQ